MTTSSIRQSRASRSNPCKVCGKANGWCLHLDNTGMICMVQELAGCKYHEKTQGYYYPPEYFDPSIKREQTTFIPKAKPVINPMADIEQRNKVNRYLLEMMMLRDDHRASLLNERKLKPETLVNFGTLWNEENWREESAETINGLVPVKGVPGFFERYMGVWSIAGPVGLLVPAIDREGRIQGFQIRRDDGKKPKYIWLSSNPEADRDGKVWYPNGTATTAFFHFAGSKKPVDLFVTEGLLKAEVAHQQTGETFLGLPGLNPGDVEDFLELFDYWTLPANFIFCPDADFRTNKQVYRAWIRNIKEIGAVYPRIRVASWDASEGKGIDDYILTHGRMPRILSARKWYEKNRIPEFEDQGAISA